MKRLKNDQDSDLILTPHQALIEGSAISPHVAAARGYRSVRRKTELRGLGFGEKQCRVPALLIPIWGVSGQIVTYQIRPDEPRINRDGRPVKYETPGGSRMVLDVPPPVLAWLGDPKRPLIVTEGARKADSAVSKGLCCIALLGVWSWRGRNELGGKIALPDWEYVALNDREVFIAFDSDIMHKPSVHNAMGRLKAFLEQRKARVCLICLPQDGGNGKTGLDDYFAAGHGVDELLALACDKLPELPRHDPDGECAGLYRSTSSGLSWAKPIHEGEVLVPLTNFRAKIIGQVLEDDGVEEKRLITIEAYLNDRISHFSVTASEFNNMNWPLRYLGAMAVVHAGFNTKDHARNAIQLLSGDVPEQRVYAHTGWRKVGEVWCYLHGGGAIGPNGPMEGVQVHLPDPLQYYDLGYPKDQEEFLVAFRASLALLEVAPDHITFPLYCSIWRAVLNPADFALYMVGPTGVGKTVVAALVQQFWGSAMDGRHLPGAWSSTGNALEGLAFAAKDVLLVVDDFAPSGTSSDVSRFHREADRLLRAQGNSAGRMRMRADSSLRPSKPPRGLILSTGEDVPRGESLRARIFVLELSPDMLRWEAISACQRDADNGLYSYVMARFIQWMAVQRDKVISDMAANLVELREEATRSGAHKRTPEIVANLALGLRYFLAFAQQIGGLDEDRAKELWQRGWKALGESAAAQAAHHASAEPTSRFVQLLRAVITAGRAHVADREGSIPGNKMVWGWREYGGEWQPQGTLVGWLDGEDLYLEPGTSFAVVQGLARDMGDGLPLTPRTLHKRLFEKGFLASTDPGRSTLTVRRVLAGSRRVVLHMHARVIMPPETDQPTQDAHDIADPALDGQEHGQLQAPLHTETAPANCPEAPFDRSKQRDPASMGSLGSFREGINGYLDQTPKGHDDAVPFPSHPRRSCYSCKGSRFWRSAHGDLVCANCHSPANPEAVVEWVTGDCKGEERAE